MANQQNQQHQNPQQKAGNFDPKQQPGKPQHQAGQPHQPGTNPTGQPKSDDRQRDQGGQRRS